jgi:cytochrome P450
MVRASGRPFDPPTELGSTVAEHPVSRVRMPSGGTPWIVTGHAEQRALLSDPRVSVDHRLPGFPHWSEEFAAQTPHRTGSMFIADPSRHARYRRMMAAPLTAQRVRAVRPVVQRLAEELLDAMVWCPAPADLVKDFAVPLPTLTITELLGVPERDQEFFEHHAAIGVDRDATPDQHRESFTAQVDYLVELVRQRVAEPRADVLSELARQVTAGRATELEAAQLGLGLLVAGHETSANMIGLSVLALLENPRQLAVLRNSQDPATVANAAEELLRYLGVIHNGQHRIANADIRVGEVLIRAGEGIIIEFATANRDPRRFPDPATLDLTRPARGHHAFGFGRHECVGRQLARVELQVVLGTIFQRIPTIHLAAPVHELEFIDDGPAYGLYELPVAW